MYSKIKANFYQWVGKDCLFAHPLNFKFNQITKLML